MAITLNKFAIRCEEDAICAGKITSESSPRILLYQISGHWRELLNATGSTAIQSGEWSEKEIAARNVLIATLAYLSRIGCSNIEKLLKDSFDQQKRHNE